MMDTRTGVPVTRTAILCLRPTTASVQVLKIHITRSRSAAVVSSLVGGRGNVITLAKNKIFYRSSQMRLLIMFPLFPENRKPVH